MNFRFATVDLVTEFHCDLSFDSWARWDVLTWSVVWWSLQSHNKFSNTIFTMKYNSELIVYCPNVSRACEKKAWTHKFQRRKLVLKLWSGEWNSVVSEESIYLVGCANNNRIESFLILSNHFFLWCNFTGMGKKKGDQKNEIKVMLLCRTCGIKENVVAVLTRSASRQNQPSLSKPKTFRSIDTTMAYTAPNPSPATLTNMDRTRDQNIPETISLASVREKR